jgi:hypothetical protein
MNNFVKAQSLFQFFTKIRKLEENIEKMQKSPQANKNKNSELVAMIKELNARTAANKNEIKGLINTLAKETKENLNNPEEYRSRTRSPSPRREYSRERTPGGNSVLSNRPRGNSPYSQGSQLSRVSKYSNNYRAISTNFLKLQNQTIKLDDFEFENLKSLKLSVRTMLGGYYRQNNEFLVRKQILRNYGTIFKNLKSVLEQLGTPLKNTKKLKELLIRDQIVQSVVESLDNLNVNGVINYDPKTPQFTLQSVRNWKFNELRNLGEYAFDKVMEYINKNLDEVIEKITFATQIDSEDLQNNNNKNLPITNTTLSKIIANYNNLSKYFKQSSFTTYDLQYIIVNFNSIKNVNINKLQERYSQFKKSQRNKNQASRSRESTPLNNQNNLAQKLQVQQDLIKEYARKVEELKATSQSRSPTPEQQPQSPATEPIILPDTQRQNSATKIQAAVRGWKNRKNVEKMRDNATRAKMNQAFEAFLGVP